jgi:transposase
VVSKLDRGRLVFVDEMGTHTSLAPLYGYSPRGKRAFFKLPRNRGKNTTLLASIGCEGMGLLEIVEGSTSGEAFEAYVEHFLTPALREGQVVVMDNLSSREESRVQERIEERGCALIYLPPSEAPIDLNPIEEAFSKIKRFLRELRARVRGALVEAIGRALEAVSARGAESFLMHCGYRTLTQRL